MYGRPSAEDRAVSLVRRLWPFLLLAILTVWIGALALTRVDLDLLSAVLGIALYAGTDLAGRRVTIGRAAERVAGPCVGAVNGVLTGMTGSYIVPGVMFLQAIGLGRDERVQAMGLLFTFSTIAIFVSLGNSGLLATDRLAASALALIPTGICMIAGQRLRTVLSEATFRRATMVCLFSLGLYLIGYATLAT